MDGAPLHEPGVAEPLVYSDGPVAGYDPFGAVALAVDTDGQLIGDDGAYAIRGASRVLITVASSASPATTGTAVRRSTGTRTSAAPSRRPRPRPRW